MKDEVFQEEIDPEDPIEKLICESIRIGEIAAKRQREGIGPIEEIDALNRESERLWNEAKRLGTQGVTRKNYEDLANAFLKACVDDYEELISGAAPGNNRNVALITDVLEHQQFVKLDMVAQLKHIDKVYKERFVPYVCRNLSKIKRQWKDFNEKHLNDQDISRLSANKCPLCGGILRPWLRDNVSIIGCTGCSLFVKECDIEKLRSIKHARNSRKYSNGREAIT